MTARAGNGGQQRIVVGVDGSVPSKAALSWAVEQGRLTGAVVEAVIAWEFPATYGYPVPVSGVNWEQLAQQVVSRGYSRCRRRRRRGRQVTLQGRGGERRPGAAGCVSRSRAAGRRQPRPWRIRRGAARVDRPALRASRHLPRRGDPRLGHRLLAGRRLALMKVQALVGRILVGVDGSPAAAAALRWAAAEARLRGMRLHVVHARDQHPVEAGALRAAERRAGCGRPCGRGIDPECAGAGNCRPGRLVRRPSGGCRRPAGRCFWSARLARPCSSWAAPALSALPTPRSASPGRRSARSPVTACAPHPARW